MFYCWFYELYLDLCESNYVTSKMRDSFDVTPLIYYYYVG